MTRDELEHRVRTAGAVVGSVALVGLTAWGRRKRRPERSAAPSGRQILDRELWESVAGWAHQAYWEQGLTLSGVADLLNRRYPGAGFHEAGVRLMFSDFLLPLRQEGVSRPVPNQGGPFRAPSPSELSAQTHQIAMRNNYETVAGIHRRGY